MQLRVGLRQRECMCCNTGTSRDQHSSDVFLEDVVFNWNKNQSNQFISHNEDKQSSFITVQTVLKYFCLCWQIPELSEMSDLDNNRW